ncbi:MAG: DNA polymerase III subunit delta [Microcystis panniformis]
MAIVLLSGTETYGLQRRLKQLRHQWADTQLGELGYRRLDAPRLASFHEALMSVGFSFGSLPVLEVHDPEGLASPAEGKHDEALIQRLLSDWEATTEQKNVILVLSKLDKKLKTTKQLLALPNLTHEEFTPPLWYDTKGAAQRVCEECQHQGIRLAHDAAELLCEALGHDLYPLMTECQRLHTFLGGQALTASHIRQYVQLPSSDFDLVRAWLQPTPLTANHWQTLQQRLLKDDPLRMIALMGSELKKALHLKARLASGASAESIAKERFPKLSEKDQGKKAWGINKNEIQPLAGCSLPRLQHLHDALLEAHIAIKTGQQTSQLALELLLTQ